MLNLVTDAWLPVLRGGGRQDVIAPAQLTEAWDTNPVIALDWPRADFRVATLELLVGLLATACPPRDDNAWAEWWEVPPSTCSRESRRS